MVVRDFHECNSIDGEGRDGDGAMGESNSIDTRMVFMGDLFLY